MESFWRCNYGFDISSTFLFVDICLFNWKCEHYSKNNLSNRSRMIFYATFCKKNEKKNLRSQYYYDKQNSYNSKKNKSLLFT